MAAPPEPLTPKWFARAFGRILTVGLLLVLRVGGAVAAFALTLVLAQEMSPAEMGRAMTLMSTAILLSVAASGGLEAGAVRFIARYREAANPSPIRGFLGLTRWVTLALGSICVIGAGIAVWVGASSFGLAVALTAAAVLGLLRVGAAHALAFDSVIASLAPSTFLRQVFLLVIVATAAKLMGYLDVGTVLLAFLLANVAALSVQIITNRHIIEVDSGPSDRSQWREWTIYGLQMAPALLFVQYSRDLTLFVSAWTLAPADVAVLGVATALIAFVKFAVVAVNQSITPTMAALIEREDSEGLAELIRTSNMLKMGIMIASVAGAGVFGSSVLGLFGDAFRGATSILLILMIEPWMLAFFGPAGQYLALSGQQAIIIPIALFALAVMAAGITLGAWLAGLLGAALGLAVGWTVWTASLALSVRLRSGVDVTAIGTIRSWTGQRWF